MMQSSVINVDNTTSGRLIPSIPMWNREPIAEIHERSVPNWNWEEEPRSKVKAAYTEPTNAAKAKARAVNLAARSCLRGVSSTSAAPPLLGKDQETNAQQHRPDKQAAGVLLDPARRRVSHGIARLARGRGRGVEGEIDAALVEALIHDA